MIFRGIFSKAILSVLLISLMLCSCDSDDINPALDVSIDGNELSEIQGSVTITAQINGPAAQTIVIPVNFAGSATFGVDYNSSASGITINSGQTSGNIILTGIEDGLVEGVETIEISLGSTPNVIILSNIAFTITVLDADVDSDNDSVPDALDECPNLPGDINNNGCPFIGFIINEVLYDPAADLAGDANGDGFREAQEDEFIEFYNSAPDPLDLSGYTISDADQLRHTFPSGTVIPSNGVIVVFGGGTPTGSFGGAIVQTASEGRLNLNNAGDFVTVRDNQDNTILTFDIFPLDSNPNESYTRNPDLLGDFVIHSSVAESNGAIFSPGTKLDGSSF